MTQIEYRTCPTEVIQAGMDADFFCADLRVNLRNLREAFKKNLRGALNPLTL